MREPRLVDSASASSNVSREEVAIMMRMMGPEYIRFSKSPLWWRAGGKRIASCKAGGGLRSAFRAAGVVANVSVLLGGLPAGAASLATLHYSPNQNFDSSGKYLPGKVGFNLADVGNVDQLAKLPAGAKGLAWIGQCQGANADFVHAVQPYIGNPKLFGFYLMDGPDPTGKYSRLCTAVNLKAESDWVHAHAPDAKTFIVLMNMASSKTPSFADGYTPANSGIDLFGVNPFPCRSELNGCDYDMIDRYFAAAEASGLPRDRIVPVYQAFGGGNRMDDGSGHYTLPTVAEVQKILARWKALVKAPVFDIAYSWGSQDADAALAEAPELQAVFAAHNGAPAP